MRMPVSSTIHTFPWPSVTFQRCWCGSDGIVVGGAAVTVVVGEMVVDDLAVDGVTLTTIVEAFMLE